MRYRRRQRKVSNCDWQICDLRLYAGCLLDLSTFFFSGNRQCGIGVVSCKWEVGGASGRSPCDPRLKANMMTAATNAEQSNSLTLGAPMIALHSLDFAASTAEATRRIGNNSIRRAKFAGEPPAIQEPSGNCETSAANLNRAGSLGRPASSAASTQGSTSSRASAERTLSGISFLPMPKDA